MTSRLPPGFEGFDASDVFDDVDMTPREVTPDILRFLSLQRGDMFKLDGHRISWICIRRLSEYTIFAVKSTQARRAKHWFVIQRQNHEDGLVAAFKGAGADVRPVGEVVDAGYVSDISVGAVDLT